MDTDYSVIVAGYGPVGACAANLLGYYKIKSLVIDKEKEIIEAQVSDSQKPQEILEKMTSGRLKKFLSEVSLIDQPFVKDPSIKISDLIKNSDNSVISFIRYEVGEGIEVEKKDFAEEVKAQLDN